MRKLILVILIICFAYIGYLWQFYTYNFKTSTTDVEYNTEQLKQQPNNIETIRLLEDWKERNNFYNENKFEWEIIFFLNTAAIVLIILDNRKIKTR